MTAHRLRLAPSPHLPGVTSGRGVAVSIGRTERPQDGVTEGLAGSWDPRRGFAASIGRTERTRDWHDQVLASWTLGGIWRLGGAKRTLVRGSNE